MTIYCIFLLEPVILLEWYGRPWLSNAALSGIGLVKCCKCYVLQAILDPDNHNWHMATLHDTWEIFTPVADIRSTAGWLTYLFNNNFILHA